MIPKEELRTELGWHRAKQQSQGLLSLWQVCSQFSPDGHGCHGEEIFLKGGGPAQVGSRKGGGGL